LIKSTYTQLLSEGISNSRHSVKLNIRFFLQLFCQSKSLKETFLLKPKEQQMGFLTMSGSK
jgi:hypothetical protein